MVPYITPNRYRTSGFGLDVSGIEDAELRTVLSRASSLVEAYCAIPQLPQKHDFRGGTITREQHMWRLAGDFFGTATMGSRRVYPYNRPVKALTSFVVKFTNTYQVTIDPANCYVNNMDGWIEVVSLAAVVTGIYPVGINFGLYTPVVEIGYTYGYTFPVVGEQLYVTDGQTYQSSRGNWDPSVAPVIYKNGSVVPSGYVISYDEGEVVFSAQLAATDVITADFTYTLPDAIADATAITASHLLSERSLLARGFAGLSSIKIAEVALTRVNSRQQNLTTADQVPSAAQSMLDSFIFRSVG